MTVTLTAYAVDGVTSVGTLDTARDISFRRQLNGRGSLGFTWSPGIDSAGAAACDPNRWVRVAVNGTDVGAWRIPKPTKERSDSATVAGANSAPTTRVSAVTGHAALADGLLYPQGGLTYDYGKLSARRWFGAMSASYDDSAWADTLVSEGTAGSQPISFKRHIGFPDQTAQVIWADDGTIDGDGQVDEGVLWLRREFTIATATQAIVACSADNEYVLWLDGAQLLKDDHPTARDTTRTVIVDLAPGEHVITLRVENLVGSFSTTRAWVVASVIESVDGILAGVDETFELELGASVSAGTWTITYDGRTSTAIDWDATAAQVQDAIVASGVGGRGVDVTVEGDGTSGTPFVVTCDGWTDARETHTLTADGSGLTGGGVTVTNTVDATAPTVYVQTDTSASWAALLRPSSTPGLTIGQIVTDVVDELVARATAAGQSTGVVSTDVTASADSDAVSWPTTHQIGIPVGRTVEQALQELVDLGCDFDMTPAGVVQAWVRRGSDLSGTVALDARAESTSDAEAVQHSLSPPTATALLVQHQGGYVEVGDRSPTVRVEKFLTLGQAATDEVAAGLARPVLLEMVQQRDDSRILVSDVVFAGFDDATLGDTITATDWFRFQEPHRIMGIGGQVDTAGNVDWTVDVVPTDSATARRMADRRGTSRDDAVAQILSRLMVIESTLTPGSIGGRAHLASPVIVQEEGQSRAAIGAPLLSLASIANQSDGEGDVVSLSPSASGGVAPLSWSVTGLPSGLSINATTGAITGTVDVGAGASSPYTVTVTVTSADGQTAEREFTWTVTAVAAATSYFPADGSTTYWSQADSTESSVVGDIDIRVDAAMDNWQTADQPLVSKWVSSSAYYLSTTLTTGRMAFGWGSSGTATSGGHGYGAGVRGQVRVTVDVNDGAGGSEFRFYKRDLTEDLPLSDNTAWVEITPSVTDSAFTIPDTTSAVEVGRFIGSLFAAGDFYEALILDGIEGTVAAHFDPTNDYGGVSGGSTSFDDVNGNTWVANGGATITIP